MSTTTVKPQHIQELSIQGIQSNQITYNPDYETLFQAETDLDLQHYERGHLTNLDAITVDTGEFTGRSPKDKYIVYTGEAINEVWWSEDGSDNQKLSTETWHYLQTITTARLNHQKLYVVDGFCGANIETRLSVRLVTEVAWMAHFFKNMFIRPTIEELKTFTPDWTILNACKTSAKEYQKYGLNSETYIAFNIEERMTLIGNTWYGGEIKKGIFSMMNYFLPLREIGSFHCSANRGNDGSVAMFFGLSGTGKTTLSTDPKRALIGDDEHGWDEQGVFNLEGGCYAKTIDLDPTKEPDIYHAIRRDALLENVVFNSETGVIDFTSNTKTENTRVSYPLYHIDNIVKPISTAGHPNKIIFLTCDAYGVLPPVAKLNIEQAMYQFLSGYTAKVAGTERGVTEPKAVFSACYGQPFLLLHPTRYAKILADKMKQHNTQAYLVNTGWSGGPYGVGKRISIAATRTIIDAILSGDIEHTTMRTDDLFGFQVPTSLTDVNTLILTPENTWPDSMAYQKAYQHLAHLFRTNFKRFENTKIGQSLMDQV